MDRTTLEARHIRWSLSSEIVQQLVYRADADMAYASMHRPQLLYRLKLSRGNSAPVQFADLSHPTGLFFSLTFNSARPVLLGRGGCEYLHRRSWMRLD